MNQAQRFAVVVVSAILFLAAAADEPKVTSDDSRTKDKVAIVVIQPAGPVPRGVETEFTFDIQYTLETIEEGVLTIGFNTGSHGSRPNAFEEVESRVIKRGTGPDYRQSEGDSC
jgi:hypothetical protein